MVEKKIQSYFQTHNNQVPIEVENDPVGQAVQETAPASEKTAILCLNGERQGVLVDSMRKKRMESKKDREKKRILGEGSERESAKAR